MFTISCYYFHPLILRFVKLWKCVQVVSEVITCVLSVLCCQCIGLMPPLSITDSSKGPPNDMLENEISPESRKKSNPQKLQEHVITVSNQQEQLSSPSVSKNQLQSINNNALPAVHKPRTLGQKGTYTIVSRVTKESPK